MSLNGLKMLVFVAGQIIETNKFNRMGFFASYPFI